MMADRSFRGKVCGMAECRKLLEDGTLFMLVGYEKDLVYMLDLELMELDFGIKVLIFVVCITLLLDLLDEAEEDEADRATEEYDFDV